MSKKNAFLTSVTKKLQENPDLAKAVADDLFNVGIATQIYDWRTLRGMTQKELADKIDTGQSAIARMEDADYQGHSISTLRKIADAFGCVLHLEFREKLQPLSESATTIRTCEYSDFDTKVEGRSFPLPDQDLPAPKVLPATQTCEK